jgi:hypothetical protein
MRQMRWCVSKVSPNVSYTPVGLCMEFRRCDRAWSWSRVLAKLVCARAESQSRHGDCPWLLSPWQSLGCTSYETRILFQNRKPREGTPREREREIDVVQLCYAAHGTNSRGLPAETANNHTFLTVRGGGLVFPAVARTHALQLRGGCAF